MTDLLFLYRSLGGLCGKPVILKAKEIYQKSVALKAKETYQQSLTLFLQYLLFELFSSLMTFTAA